MRAQRTALVRITHGSPSQREASYKSLAQRSCAFARALHLRIPALLQKGEIAHKAYAAVGFS